MESALEVRPMASRLEAALNAQAVELAVLRVKLIDAIAEIRDLKQEIRILRHQLRVEN